MVLHITYDVQYICIYVNKTINMYPIFTFGINNNDRIECFQNKDNTLIIVGYYLKKAHLERVTVSIFSSNM